MASVADAAPLVSLTFPVTESAAQSVGEACLAEFDFDSVYVSFFDLEDEFKLAEVTRRG